MPTQISNQMLDDIVTNISNAEEHVLGATLLLSASTLLETAGYELARSHGSSLATRVILQASETEKLALSLAAGERTAAKETDNDT